VCLGCWQHVRRGGGGRQAHVPRAVLSSMALVLLTYLIPLLAGTGAYPASSSSDWDDGYFSVVGAAIGGPWLGAWITCAAALSTWGQFEAEMSRWAGGWDCF